MIGEVHLKCRRCRRILELVLQDEHRVREGRVEVLERELAVRCPSCWRVWTYTMRALT